jgi:hypothetical protein
MKGVGFKFLRNQTNLNYAQKFGLCIAGGDCTMLISKPRHNHVGIGAVHVLEVQFGEARHNGKAVLQHH